MNQDDTTKRTSPKYYGNRVSSGFVITIVTLLLFVLLLLVLMKLDVIGTPEILHNLLGTGELPEPEAEIAENDLPEFSSGDLLTDNRYHTFSVDPREILASLTPMDAYVREFRVMNFYGDDADISKYTLTVRGPCYRLEADHKTVICDGTSAATVTGTYRTMLDGTVFTPENEVGMTSLSAIQKASEKGSVTLSADDNKQLLIVTEDAETDILTEYLVSIETGVVMSERAYLDGVLYRAVITDSVDIFAAENLPADYFALPTFDQP